MAHQPIQFGDHKDSDDFGEVVEPLPPGLRPTALDLKKDTALTITWSDGRVSVYPVGYLRKNSPSAEAKAFREKQAENPLTVLPTSASNTSGKPFQAENAELIGNYALRIEFSDGHRTGLYTWAYLREIDPAQHGSPDNHNESQTHQTPPDRKTSS
ncbi:gamma-butyrobetaine hydroxylase-like domain-containing protein [Algisphaera agarilytica]|uniref:DUF971 family protein n=1 Tax=Algisphaera agarilytica TaxID=1385975 RepID=A0A7X0LJM3_9BACT|nr:DUF971 domain-containing protein [Algisphaera agarilytica]MBB6428894.1 DUF971 family protein [Algisphaera agarilytica]